MAASRRTRPCWPLDVLQKPVIVAAAWAIVRWRRSLGNFASPVAVRHEAHVRRTDLKGHTQVTTGLAGDASDREESSVSGQPRITRNPNMTEATAAGHSPVGGRPFPSGLFQRIIGDMAGGVASPRFVGRSVELGRLEAAFAQARSGAPVTVCVGGEAGVGKTRLVSEFAARVRQSGGQVLLGGCIELGESALPVRRVAGAFRGPGGELLLDRLQEQVGAEHPKA